MFSSIALACMLAKIQLEHETQMNWQYENNSEIVKTFSIPDPGVGSAVTKEMPTVAKMIMTFEKCMLSVSSDSRQIKGLM
jgi:hypothetical protein